MTQIWVYMLRCRDGSYYTGHTDGLEKRLWQHHEGLAADWTRRRRPVELVWCDWAPTRYEALAFERRVKNWSRAKKEALIAGDWARVGHFARPPHERGSPGAATAPTSHERPSTSLGTNEIEDRQHRPKDLQPAANPFVPSEGSPGRRRRVERRTTSGRERR